MANPAVSRRASIRLPWYPRSCKPPYDPGRRDFPVPVLTLACPRRAFPVAAWLKPRPAYTRQCAGLLIDSSPLRGTAFPRLRVRAPSWDRQVPRAPLHRRGITASMEALNASWKRVTPSSSLVRAHAPDLLPSVRLRHGLARAVLAGCCQPLLGTGPSRRYLCRSVPTCLDPYSGCSQGARARCFPQDIGLPRIRIGSALWQFPAATSAGARYRSCSHSLMFRPTGLLATPVAPTARFAALGGSGFYIRAYRASLPQHAADMLSAQIRAIDGKRTFTSQDRQPCRLLP